MTIPKTPLGKRAWEAWLRFGMALGNFLLRWVWMPVFYFIIAMPFALVVRFFLDPLRARRGRQASYWTPKRLPKLDLEWARRQGSVPPSES